MSRADDFPDLGSCCGCGATADVTNIVMLPYRAKLPGHGWGCVTCGLPSDGALAVLCDTCARRFTAINSILIACAGYPGEDGRVPVSELDQFPFDHDMGKHRAAGF